MSTTIQDLETQRASELAVCQRFIETLRTSDGAPIPGAMVVSQANFDTLMAHCKGLGFTWALFTDANLRAAYNDARALGILELVPIPPVVPPPPQIVEVQVAPPDRRNRRDKLRDVGVFE